MTKAIYAGTFDPITLGHLDIIKRSIKFCDHLVIAVGINSNKKTLFSESERMEMIRETIKDIKADISIQCFQGLLVNFAKEVGAEVLVRGIRSVSDFEYEITLANANKVLLPSVETVFLPTSPELAVVSSSMVKEIARYGAATDRFVNSFVSKAIEKKFGFTKFGG